MEDRTEKCSSDSKFKTILRRQFRALSIILDVAFCNNSLLPKEWTLTLTSISWYSMVIEAEVRNLRNLITSLQGSVFNNFNQPCM